MTGRKSYGHAASLDEAKAAFRAEYVAWKSAPEPPRRTVTIPRAYRPVMISTKRHRGAFPAVPLVLLQSIAFAPQASGVPYRFNREGPKRACWRHF